MDYREILGEFEPPRTVQKTIAPRSMPWEREDAEGLAKWLKPPVYGTQPENQAFLENIVGDMPALEKALQQVPKPEPVISTPRALNDLAKLADRLGKTWNSPKHHQVISTMLSGLKTALKFKSTPDRDAAWDRIVTTCTNYVCSAVHSEAGEETL
jgi:hypothetical protein